MRQFEAGEIVAGKYQLQRPLARGGMGSVWVAWNSQLDIPVAIKFMSPEAVGSAELVARFEREAKAAAQMRSPQVVQIFEHGVYQSVPFMAMELLEGEDLGKRLRTRGRLSLPETARIVGEVCKALRRAHELGIVHRDLKPANVFLSNSGDEEVVKVLDFGIAKVLTGSSNSEATKTGALIGTPNYMSPEQARRSHRRIDHRSDLWSLGIIAFRAITGKLPFAGEDAVDILVRICTQAAPAPSSIAPDVGPEVDRFFARALAFEPDQRFQSAREMADALNALASGAPSLPLAQSGPVWAPPLPRASSPGHSPAAPVPPYAAPLGGPPRPITSPRPEPLPAAPAAALPDPLDGAATVPLQRSPAGQAFLAAQAQPVSTPSSGPPPGMTRQSSSPYGVSPPSSGPTSGPHPAAPLSPRAFALSTVPMPQLQPQPPSALYSTPAQVGSAPRSSGTDWQPAPDPSKKPLLKTLPLDTPAIPLPAPPRPAVPSVPEAYPLTAAPVAAMTSAGESAGTITSATGEMAAVPLPRRRTSFVVWGAIAAAVVVVLVVGGVVATSLSTEPASEQPIPLPPSGVPALSADPPPIVAPAPSAAPEAPAITTPPTTPSAPATNTPVAPMTATSAPSSAPAKPTAAATTPAPKPGPAKPKNDTAIFGKPVFAN